MQVYISDSAKGPWTHHKVNGDIYDLSVLFDEDGKIYAVHKYGNVTVTELKPDLSGPVEGSRDDEEGISFGSKGRVHQDKE